MGTYFDTLILFININTKQKINFITLNNTGLKIPRVTKIKNKGGEIKNVKIVINFLDKEINTSGFIGMKKMWKLIREALLKKYELDTWYLLEK